MIENYKLEVMRFYEEKKAAGELSRNLMNPTCANLRNECRSLFIMGCNQTDQRMLKEFLGCSWEVEFNELTIKRCDTDKFKPLNNFFKAEIKTHEKNIELLAWLIDFRPRPFSNYWRLSKGKSGALSELAITEHGIVEKNRMGQEIRGSHSLSPNVAGFENTENKRAKANQVLELVKEKEDYYSPIENKRDKESEITLEYPSGVKISVDATKLSLIAQLVKL